MTSALIRETYQFPTQSVPRSQTTTDPRSQLPTAVLMVRPASFEPNPATSKTNAFQLPPVAGMTREEHARHARIEFDHFHYILQRAGVNVIILHDTEYPRKPDAVFPNNWITFHSDGTVVLYPMRSSSRRRERRLEATMALVREAGFYIRRVIDLTQNERRRRFLEGTGSIVFDTVNEVAYSCLSPRTNESMVMELCKILGYRPVCFRAVDRNGKAIYHTNVMLSIGANFALVCDEVIPDDYARSHVLQELYETGRDVITIGYDQLCRFAANVYEVNTRKDGSILAMSTDAWRSLQKNQVDLLSKHARIIEAPLQMIERGGGSARCMLAGVSLPMVNE